MMEKLRAGASTRQSPTIKLKIQWGNAWKAQHIYVCKSSYSFGVVMQQRCENLLIVRSLCKLKCNNLQKWSIRPFFGGIALRWLVKPWEYCTPNNFPGAWTKFRRSAPLLRVLEPPGRPGQRGLSWYCLQHLSDDLLTQQALHTPHCVHHRMPVNAVCICVHVCTVFAYACMCVRVACMCALKTS